MWVVGVSSLSTLDYSYRACFTWNYKRSSTIIWVLQEFIFTRCYNYILLPSFQRTFNTLLYFNLHLRFAQQFQVCQINLKGTPLKICLEFSGIIFLSTFHWPALPKLVHANIMYIRNVLLSICTHQCGWWWPTHSTWIVFIHTHTHLHAHAYMDICWQWKMVKIEIYLIFNCCSFLSCCLPYFARMLRASCFGSKCRSRLENGRTYPA